MGRKEERKRHKRHLKDVRKSKKSVLRRRYPRIEIDHDGESPCFMKTVEETSDRFDFENNSHCDTADRLMYQILRKEGYAALSAACTARAQAEDSKDLTLSVDDRRAIWHSPIFTHLGQWVFERLPEQYRTNPLPFHFFHVRPCDKNLCVNFQFMPRMPSPHGTIYFSPFEPTVSTTNGLRKVGFTRHAIERACQRLARELPIQYQQCQYLTAHFQHCVYYEPLTLPSGQEAIRMFTECRYDLSQIYLRDVAGLDDAEIANRKWFCLVGYCPVKENCDFAVATTFLCPGYRDTPEAHLVDTARISAATRHSLRTAAKDSTRADVVAGRLTEALTWYHENGAPQVLAVERGIYSRAVS